MNERTATKLSSRDDGLTINARYMRAQQMTAHVMHAIGKYITDEENDHYREAARALLDLFYDNGVDVITDQMRADAGLPPRGEKGWTEQELHVMEMRRIEAMLKPMQQVFVMVDGVKPQ
jgi:hypothetical protein